MTTIARPTARSHLGAIIWTVAAFQLLVACFSLWMFVRGVRIESLSDQYSPHTEAHVTLSVLCAIALIQIITAFGLLRLKPWARYLTLFLATAPICLTTAALIHHRPHPPWDWNQLWLQVGVAALAPISLWWWLVFTRKSVHAKFHPN